MVCIRWECTELLGKQAETEARVRLGGNIIGICVQVRWRWRGTTNDEEGALTRKDAASENAGRQGGVGSDWRGKDGLPWWPRGGPPTNGAVLPASPVRLA